MLVAIVEDNYSNIVAIKKILKKHSGWEAKYFGRGKEIIAENNINQYDAIITDQKISDIDGTELIKALRRRFNKHTYIALMSESHEIFTEHDVEDNTIDAYIYKNNEEGLNYIGEWLQKIKGRIEREKKMEDAESNIKAMVELANGYELTENGEYCVLDFNRIINKTNRDQLSKTLNKFKYCIFNISKEDQVFTSFYVGQIINIQREMKNKGIKFAIVGKDKETRNLIKLCHLNLIMNVYETIEKAVIETKKLYN